MKWARHPTLDLSGCCLPQNAAFTKNNFSRSDAKPAFRAPSWHCPFGSRFGCSTSQRDFQVDVVLKYEKMPRFVAPYTCHTRSIQPPSPQPTVGTPTSGCREVLAAVQGEEEEGQNTCRTKCDQLPFQPPPQQQQRATPLSLSKIPRAVHKAVVEFQVYTQPLPVWGLLSIRDSKGRVCVCVCQCQGAVLRLCHF